MPIINNLDVSGNLLKKKFMAKKWDVEQIEFLFTQHTAKSILLLMLRYASNRD
jgi:hypothetical protein